VENKLHTISIGQSTHQDRVQKSGLRRILFDKSGLRRLLHGKIVRVTTLDLATGGRQRRGNRVIQIWVLAVLQTVVAREVQPPYNDQGNRWEMTHWAMYSSLGNEWNGRDRGLYIHNMHENSSSGIQSKSLWLWSRKYIRFSACLHLMFFIKILPLNHSGRHLIWSFYSVYQFVGGEINSREAFKRSASLDILGVTRRGCDSGEQTTWIKPSLPHMYVCVGCQLNSNQALRLLCLKGHVRACDSTLWWYRRREATEFLCTQTPLWRKFNNNKNRPKPPEMLSPTRY